MWGYGCQVSSKSNVKAVAGKLAHSSRQGDPPIMLAMGHGCLNIAVKVRSSFPMRVAETRFPKRRRRGFV